MTQREQLYLTAKRYCRAAEDALERNIRPQGLSASRGFLLLHVLREHPGGVTLTQLHQELGLAKATLSQVVKTLREKGYLRAAVCREDERQRLLTPTEKLRKLRPELERAVRRADQALRQLETQDERKDTT